MSAKIFLGGKFKSLKADGTVNAAGTVEFFEVGGTYTTYKSTYTTTALAVVNSNTITLDSGGEATICLNGDYDVRVKDSSGTVIYTATGINPTDATSVSTYNVITNPSFEDDTNSDTYPDSWDRTVYTGGSALIDSSDRSHGANSMKFITTGNGGGTLTTSSYFPVTAGGTLEWLFDLKSTANIRNLVQMLWYDASKVALGGTPTTDLYDDSATNPTSWTRKYGSVSVPATAYFAKFKIFGGHSSNGNSGTVRFDNVNVTDISSTLAINKTFSGTNTHSGAETFSKGTGAIILSASSINQAKGSDIVAAGTTDIGAATGNMIDVTGNTTITALGTVQAGTTRRVRFTGTPIITYNATSLILPGAASITAVAGDTFTFVSLGSGNWLCTEYTPTNGHTGNLGSYARLLSVATASASNYFQFDSLFSSTYDKYEIHIVGTRPTTDGTVFKAQVGTGVGPTYDTAGNYTDGGNNNEGTANAIFGTAGRTYISLSGEIAVGNASTKPVVAVIAITSPVSAAFHKMIEGYTTFIGTGTSLYKTVFQGKYNSTTAVTGIRLFFGTAGTNTIAEGAAYLWGIRKV